MTAPTLPQSRIRDRRVTTARKRLRALVAIGWPIQTLAGHLGRDHGTVVRILNDGRGVWTDGLIEAIDDLYLDLHATWGPSVKAINRAAELGWQRPDELDARKSRRTRLSAAEKLDEFEWLIEGGVQPREAAERVGVAVATILTYYHRTGRTPIVCSQGHRLPTTGRVKDCVDCRFDHAKRRAS